MHLRGSQLWKTLHVIASHLGKLEIRMFYVTACEGVVPQCEVFRFGGGTQDERGKREGL